MFKSMVGALSIEYVSSRCRVSVACRGCLGADIMSLRQDILVSLLLSVSPVLSQTSPLRLWIAYSSVSPHYGLQAEFAFVSLSVISSLTSGLFSESNKCDRATRRRRVQGHPIRHAYAKEATAKRVIMAEKYLVDSDVDAMDGFFSPFR